jgi:hypothetical protein
MSLAAAWVPKNVPRAFTAWILSNVSGHVDPAVLAGGRHDRPEVVDVGHVGLHELGVAAGIPDQLVGRDVAVLGIFLDVGHDDRRAGVAEPGRDLAPDARRRAGYDDSLSLEVRTEVTHT